MDTNSNFSKVTLRVFSAMEETNELLMSLESHIESIISLSNTLGNLDDISALKNRLINYKLKREKQLLKTIESINKLR